MAWGGTRDSSTLDLEREVSDSTETATASRFQGQQGHEACGVPGLGPWDGSTGAGPVLPVVLAGLFCEVTVAAVWLSSTRSLLWSVCLAVCLPWGGWDWSRLPTAPSFLVKISLGQSLLLASENLTEAGVTVEALPRQRPPTYTALDTKHFVGLCKRSLPTWKNITSSLPQGAGPLS